MKIHFIGVSGIGMSAVAEISMHRGLRVTGSANEQNGLTRRLQSLGMIFHPEHRAEYVEGSEMVVMSAAIPQNNPELLRAMELELPVRLYSQYLGMLMEERHGVAIAGTHGKTTTTAMAASVASRAGMEPTVVCGGVMRQFGSNAVTGTGGLFIAEACEYNRSFLDLPKRDAIVTNIEPEHLDYYRDLDDIREAFTDFLKSTDIAGFACVNGDDPNIRSIIDRLGQRPEALRRRIRTVGYGQNNRYRILSKGGREGRYSLRLMEGDGEIISLTLPVPGRFNCINAALAAVWAEGIGISRSDIRRGLEAYGGTERRLEHLGDVKHHPVYTDYAHHPTEIGSSLEALRESHPHKRIALIFQPHQYSRTGYFLEDFVRVLGKADLLVLTQVYRQRDREDAHLSVNSGLLYEKLRESMHERVRIVEDPGSAFQTLSELLDDDDVIVFMGAGSIDDAARALASGPSRP
jgi:UDP-N-acetylmuramate--alanine ligase